MSSQVKNECDLIANQIIMAVNSMFTPAYQAKNIVRDFEDAGIEYCVIGGVALEPYNYSRATEDLDILVSKKTYPLIEKELIGNGYTCRPGSTRNLNYHTSGHKIPVDIIIEGDNKSGFIMPNPVEIRNKIYGIWFISLYKLVEMKLSTFRLEDKIDVLKLIQLNHLTSAFSEYLHLTVIEKFLDLVGENYGQMD